MKSFHTLIAQCFEAYDLQSLVVGTYSQGKREFTCLGTTGAEHGMRVDENTIYAIASCSKAFIATALMMLADEGRLDLGRPIAEYLNDFHFYDKAMDDSITAIDILAHRTGLSRHDFSWIIDPDRSVEQVVEAIRYLPPTYPLRERFHYQNHMFALASLAVEAITQKPWETMITDRIYKPLSMKRSGVNSQDYLNIFDNYALPYTKKNNQKTAIPFLNADNCACAGSLSSTADDLLKWAITHLKGGQYKQTKVFTPEVADRLHRKHMDIRDYEMFPYAFAEVSEPGYGLGWFVEQYRDHRLIHHGGSLPGFKSMVGFLPDDDFAFVILTNTDATLATATLAYQLCDTQLNLSAIDWNQRGLAIMETMKQAAQTMLDDLMPPDQDMSHYQGTYKAPGYGTLVFSADEHGLSALIANAKAQVVQAREGMLYLYSESLDPMIPVVFGDDDTIRISFDPDHYEPIVFKRVS